MIRDVERREGLEPGAPTGSPHGRVPRFAKAPGDAQQVVGRDVVGEQQRREAFVGKRVAAAQLRRQTGARAFRRLLGSGVPFRLELDPIEGEIRHPVGISST